ncbi:Lrp/AsnC family transcriptional regulator [Candidatus Woesearchaeota archaeon]|jgi:Lrp/AsnC family transcriptional regulator, leucine-responsive regulatory protein|nr:Lrp/AsnC family transcriptional regulator [Candidatus Woesearchaeota archaeon]
MDEKDKKLMTFLQINGRESLKSLSKKINLSIDSTKKRIEKLKKQGIISHFGIFIDPKSLGYDIVADNKIKLSNVTNEDRKKFIAYLTELPECIELIAISGDYDFTCVLIAENTHQFNNQMYSIREKFKTIISDWKSSFNLEVYKFEEYTFR